MDSIIINTAEKRIPIIRDGQEVGILVFNPQDVVFAEKLYRLIAEFETQRESWKSEFANVKDDTGAGLKLMREIFDDMRVQIDGVFGAGTSQMVFGDTFTFDVFAQFFTAIMPFFQAARAEKLAEYTGKKPPKKVMK